MHPVLCAHAQADSSLLLPERDLEGFAAWEQEMQRQVHARLQGRLRGSNGATQ